MDVQVEKTEACLAKISVKVPSAELEKEVQRSLKDMGGRVRMKGFRPGKVPAQVLEKQFGRQARREALQGFVRQAFERAVTENELQPAAHPRVAEEELDVLVGADFEVDLEVFLRPELDLQDYKGMEIRVPKVTVEDEELDHTLADVRRRQSRPEPVEDDGLPEDGMAIAKVALVFDGESVEERDGMRLTGEAPPPGVDEEAFRAALTGVKEGSEFELAFQFPDDFHTEELRGKDGQLRVTVSNAFRMVAPAEEDIWKIFGAEGEGDLREKARERITEAKSEQRDQAVETQLLEQLLSMHPMDLPHGLLEGQVNARLERLTQELASQDVAPEEAQARVEAETDAAYEASSKGLSALYLVEAIGQKEGLQIVDQDMRAELQEIARRNGAPLEEVHKYYSENQLFQQLATELLEKKVRRFLREHAQITEE